MRDLLTMLLILVTAIITSSTISLASELEPTCHQAKEQIATIAIQLFTGEAPEIAEITRAKEESERVIELQLCSEAERAQIKMFFEDLHI